MPLPPLVAPTAVLGNEEIARYSRHVILPGIGVEGQRRLKSARVLVVGAGGLGSPVLLYLAAAGVGTLGIVDFDTVDVSNLQRQIIHGQSDIGRSKAQSARDAIAETNPHVVVRLHEDRLDNDNVLGLFAEYDLLIDGTDNFATRYLVNDAAALLGKPYVWGSIFRFEGQVSVFWEAAPQGRAVNYRDLYPEPPPAGTVPSCAEGGVLGVLCATIGSAMATEAVKLITGAGESLLGRLLVYDALAVSYRTVRLRKDPAAAPITALVDYEALCGLPSAVGVRGAADGALEVAPAELAALLGGDAQVALIDVREQVEWDIVHLPGATLIPVAAVPDALAHGRIPRDRPVVLYCKTGIRSANVLADLRASGLANVRHLRGGIEAWGRELDPVMPRY